MNKKKTTFVLGPRDPEMIECERILSQRDDVHIVYASLLNRRVKSSQAYVATGVLGQIDPSTKIVVIECSVMGLVPDVVIDHHLEGQPGFYCGPEDYLKGSSLGQLLSLFEMEPTEEQRIIAAADHCPAQAYAGLCPGVDPEKLAKWRTATRAQRRGISVEEMEQKILEGRNIIESSEVIEFADSKFFWLDSRDNEVTEASARFGLPFMYKENAEIGQKVGLMGAKPDVVKKWIGQASGFLQRVYGSPARGYAGGYTDKLVMT